jgi:glycosyltransferase involved in cell wall biosynthesis
MDSSLRNKTPLRICFVAHNAFGAISGHPTGHIGGVERQVTLMAKWFAARGYLASILTWDHGQSDGSRIDNVTLFPICRRDQGIPGLRFFHPRWTGLVRAMSRADADIYYHNCGEYVTGQVALWCRRHRRKFVYSVASDPDCDRNLPEMQTLRERLFYRYGLRRADRVIVQTQRQQRLLRQGWAIDSTVIPMPSLVEDAGSYDPPSPPNPKTARVLWIGRIGPEKRIDWLLDVAERCPDVTFDLVGDAHEQTPHVLALKQRARSLPNVELHGYVRSDQTVSYYRRAALLCCTSAFEGFPNTFLEAWCQGRPIVSTFDPDNLIAEKNLGLTAHDVAGLVRGIRQLLQTPDLYRQVSENARRYFLDNHTSQAVMSRFENVFLDMFRNGAEAIAATGGEQP